MTNATDIMAAAIEDAKVREVALRVKEGPRRFPGHSYGVAETPLGAIAVQFVVAQGRTTFRPEHMRQTWTLNGKRISRDKLAKALMDA